MIWFVKVMECIEKYVNEYFTVQYRVDAPVSVLLIFHGILESTERYAELAEYLSRYSISVVVFDMPGHGRTLATEIGVFRKYDVLSSIDLLYVIVTVNHKYCRALYISGCKDVMGCGLKEFDNVIKFSGARHELLHETNRQEVFELIRKEIMTYSEH